MGAENQGAGMGKLKDLTGKRFGKLTAIEFTGRFANSRSAIWKCICECGNEIEINSNALTTGNTRSCGCLRNGGIGGGIGGGKPNDLTGKRFGKLTVIEKAGRGKDRNTQWVVRCDCGNTRIVSARFLNNGSITSCGCKYKPYDHSHERLHAVYHGMKSRCYYKRNSSYKWYGAKGVSVCDEWRDDFSAFCEWALANGYDENAPRGRYTLDRIDPFGNYLPSNCRWITIEEQQLNKRRGVVK